MEWLVESRFGDVNIRGFLFDDFRYRRKRIAPDLASECRNSRYVIDATKRIAG